MNRLLLTSLAVFVAGVAPTAVRAQVSAQQAVYTIAGDLQGAQRCSFPDRQRVTVRDLLSYAGVNNARGNAVVLRGQPLQFLRSENLTPESVQQSEPLVAGDVVIFRRLQNWSSQIKNVVVVSSQGVQVLDFDITTGLSFGQLPGGTQLSQPVTVTRTSWGAATPEIRDASEPVQHGDVVQIDMATPFGRNVPGNMRIADYGEPTVNLPTPSPAGQQSAALSSLPGLTIPGIENSASTDAVDEFSPFHVVESSGIESDTENSDDPFRTASFQSGIDNGNLAADADEIIAGLPTENSMASTSPASSSALWNVLFVLGLVFALGLIAIGWVKTQQEQRLEIESASQFQTGLSETQSGSASLVDHEDVIELVPASASKQTEDEELNEEQILQTLNEPVNSDVEPVLELDDELWAETSDPVDANSMLGTAESTDLKNSAVVSDDCPILSAGFDLLAIEGDSGEEQGAVIGVEVLESQLDIDDQSSGVEADSKNLKSLNLPPNSPLVGADEWFGADWRATTTTPVAASQVVEEIEDTSLAKEAVEAEMDESNENVGSDTATLDELEDVENEDSDVDDTVVETREERLAEERQAEIRSAAVSPTSEVADVLESTGSRGDLEDLIHNRLPMELKQVDLPLKVTLFGRPSGPKRLRIDAAHSQIAAPHMMSGARRNRRPEKVVAAVERSETSPAEDQNTAGTVEPNSGMPGLDKALNFIDERADS